MDYLLIQHANITRGKVERIKQKFPNLQYLDLSSCTLEFQNQDYQEGIFKGFLKFSFCDNITHEQSGLFPAKQPKPTIDYCSIISSSREDPRQTVHYSGQFPVALWAECYRPSTQKYSELLQINTTLMEGTYLSVEEVFLVRGV